MKRLQLSVGALTFVACMAAHAVVLTGPGFYHLERVAGTHPFERGEIIDQMTQTFSYRGQCCGGQGHWITSATVEGMVVRTPDGTLDFHWRYRADSSYDEPSPYGPTGDPSYLVLWDFFDPQFTYDAKAFSQSVPEGDAEVWVDDPAFPIFGEFWRPRNNIYIKPWGYEWFFFDTDARHYDKNSQVGSHTLSLVIGGSGFEPSFQPIAAIPEPSTWASLGLGIGLLAAVARRRTTAAAPA